jgi:hypothetical protein
MILFEKYGCHQPLNRQAERYAREGVEISLSTMAGHVGSTCFALTPVFQRIEAYVLAAERLYGDDTTVPVLAKGGCDTGRCWVYVRDDRPFGGTAPPAALFYYSRDRAGAHPRTHLATYAGILQADAYSGYGKLYDPARHPGAVTEALCWAHARRKLFELADIAAAAKRRAHGKSEHFISPLALEGVRRIDALFAIERDINGKRADERLTVRQALSRPLVEDLHAWMMENRAKLAPKSPIAKAMDYMLKRWPGFTRFLEDGRIDLSNNAAERALRGIAKPASLCTPSSSVCKHWKGTFVGDATRATFTGHGRLDRFRRQVIGADLIRRTGHNLHRRHHTSFDQTPYRMACHF